MQEEAVALLVNGVVNVMRHLGMIESIPDATATPNDEARMTNGEGNSKAKKTARSAVATTVLTKFEWLYTNTTGIWYPKVASGDLVNEGEQIGTVGDLFGDGLEKINSPVNGVVLFLTINPSVLENGLLVGIGVK